MPKKSSYTDQTQPPYFQLDILRDRHKKAALRLF